jgi:hypothetical protein
MSCQALEQICDFGPTLGQTRMYETIDRYISGTTALYTFELPKPLIGPIGGQNSPYGFMQKPDYLEGGIERIRQPEWDPKNGEHMNYEIVIPGFKNLLINIHIPMKD